MRAIPTSSLRSMMVRRSDRGCCPESRRTPGFSRVTCEGWAPSCRTPQSKRHGPGRVSKVLVGGPQSHLVALAKLNQQGIDAADLDAPAATEIATICCGDVVLLITGDGGLLGGLPAHTEGVIEPNLIEGKVCGHG